uniref:Uncharacterized protein n=1 Tax=Panagrolaimus davidi TaxID=227884 RepID=A0A914PGH0_9BILA
MIFDENTNKIIPVDKIYKLLPNIENFYYSKPSNLHFEILSTETFTNFLRLTKPDSLNSFKLENFAVSQFFDPQALFAFILSSAGSGAVFTLNVKFSLPFQEYEFLEAADTLLEKWSGDTRKKPIINIRTN